ncbi:MAG: TOBE domain-containing protein [Methanobacterium sp.]
MDNKEKWAKYKLDIELKIDDKIVYLNNKKSKLLQCIDTYGSIAQASKETKIPYRTALKNIEIMENELGSPVVITHRGGKGGGGSSELTDTGKQIIREFKKFNSVLKKGADLNEINGQIETIDEKNKIMNIDIDEKNIFFPLDHNLHIGDNVSMLISPEDIFVTLKPQESSVRNILKVKIVGMELKNEMVRLMVKLNHSTLYADITEYSREKLGLKLNMDVFIGFKATSVTIIK